MTHTKQTSVFVCFCWRMFDVFVGECLINNYRTAEKLHLNNNKSDPNGTVKYSVGVLLRFCFSCHIGLHPSRETLQLHLLRFLKKVTSPLDSCVTT